MKEFIKIYNSFFPPNIYRFKDKGTRSIYRHFHVWKIFQKRNYSLLLLVCRTARSLYLNAMKNVIVLAAT